MSDLLSVWNGSVCLGSCGPKCYNSTNQACTCVCLGLCHGHRRTEAKKRIDQYLKLLVQQWDRDQPNAVVLIGHGKKPVPPLEHAP